MTRGAFVLAALCAASPLLAQTPAATPAQSQLRVTVLDQTGAGIPSAIVIATAAGGAPVKVTADQRGAAVLPALPTADVQLHVEAQGFEPSDAALTLRRGAKSEGVLLPHDEGLQLLEVLLLLGEHLGGLGRSAPDAVRDGHHLAEVIQCKVPMLPLGI